MKMFQISEDDLAKLESLLPDITELAFQTSPTLRIKMKIRQAKEIISNVRWNYQPHSQTEKVDDEPTGDTT